MRDPRAFSIAVMVMSVSFFSPLIFSLSTQSSGDEARGAELISGAEWHLSSLCDEALDLTMDSWRELAQGSDPMVRNRRKHLVAGRNLGDQANLLGLPSRHLPSGGG